MAIITQATLRRLRLPLHTPYRLSYRTFTEFEPFFLMLEDDEGRRVFSDAHVSPGSSTETREGAWAYCIHWLERLVGTSCDGAIAALQAQAQDSKVATTILATALEAWRGSPWLKIAQDTELPLITPLNATEPEAIAQEVERKLADGFRTFKVKVGKDVAADTLRTNAILASLAGRGTIRLDANRAYDREQAIRFITGINPEGADLFEQPCDTDAWDDNAAVARASPVPLMLDEPICTLADIERAGSLDNVGYCKVKLKRFGSLESLAAGIQAVHDRGMLAVLGDGLGSDINNWMEAAVAAHLLKTEGEFNGFLKHIDRLFLNPLPFSHGRIRLPAGYVPQLDEAAIDRLTIDQHFIER